LKLLEAYRECDGVSADAYHPHPRWHAMAEALYLESVIEAGEARLISPKLRNSCAEESVERLATGAIDRVPEQHARWGLGFAVNHCPADEPYSVTSGLAACALAKAVHSGLGGPGAPDLLAEALEGLRMFERHALPGDAAQAFAPVFSPNLPALVDNGIAVWARALVKGAEAVGQDGEQGAFSAAEYVRRRRTAGLGWAYADDSPVYDLVHQCYIIESLCELSDYAEFEREALESLSFFRRGRTLVDTARASGFDEAVSSLTRSGIIDIDFRNGVALTIRITPARIWSVGALLSCYALFLMNGLRREMWRALIRRFPREHVDGDTGLDFRQEMHLARGLALSVRALCTSGAEL